jgi:hypothetical protein
LSFPVELKIYETTDPFLSLQGPVSKILAHTYVQPRSEQTGQKEFSGMEKKDLTLHKRKRGGILDRVMGINVRDAPHLLRLPDENS